MQRIRIMGHLSAKRVLLLGGKDKQTAMLYCQACAVSVLEGLFIVNVAQESGRVVLESVTDLTEGLQRLLEVLGDSIEMLEKLTELLLRHLYRASLTDLPLPGCAFDDLPQVGNVERFGNVVEGVEA